MRTDMHNAKVGDFVYTSCGYDQTNVSFYRIVGETPSGKSLRVQQVMTSRDPMGSQEAVTPTKAAAVFVRRNHDTGDYTETVAQVHTVRRLSGHVKVEGHYGWLWDGTPQYATAPGWGH
jgi:hypothetical protein